MLATALANPVAAAAGEPLVVDRGPQLSLHGPGGYRIEVSGSSRSVTVSVSRGGATTDYRVAGRATDAGISAAFGHLGRISVAFKPSGRVTRTQPLPGCTGAPLLSRKGRFVGTIRFRGEGGYTSVTASAAPGEVKSGGRWSCGRGGKGTARLRRAIGGEAKEGETPATLGARCGELEFVAVGGRSSAQAAPIFPDEEKAITLFLASSREERGSVSILRSALSAARESAFLFDEGFTSATVRPPRPFDGSATFGIDSAGQPTWTGGLEVSFPGRKVALTGPRFSVALGRAKGRNLSMPGDGSAPSCRRAR